MRNVFFLALIGAGLIIGILYVQPAAEVLSVITAAGIFISLFLNYSTKLSADDAARKADAAERKATLSVQKSVDNHALLEETKRAVDETHKAVNSGLTRQLDAAAEVGRGEGMQAGREQAEAREDVLHKREKGQT